MRKGAIPATYLSAATNNNNLCRLGKKKSKEFIVDLLWNADILTESAEEEKETAVDDSTKK